MALEITSENFQKEVMESEIPVLADFWAEWCVPCKMVGPVVEEISKQYSGKIKVVKVNVDDMPDIAQKYNIISIPTLMVFNKGETVNQMVGAGNKASIEKLFADFI